MDDGTIGHAELEIGSQVVMLATPNRDYQSPKTHRGNCGPPRAGSTTRGWWTASWYSSTTSTHITPARRGGSQRDPSSRGGPDGRLYTAEDIEGHRWMFQQA